MVFFLFLLLPHAHFCSDQVHKWNICQNTSRKESFSPIFHSYIRTTWNKINAGKMKTIQNDVQDFGWLSTFTDWWRWFSAITAPWTQHILAYFTWLSSLVLSVTLEVCEQTCFILWEGRLQEIMSLMMLISNTILKI
jgi:hypothetical protein